VLLLAARDELFERLRNRRLPGSFPLTFCARSISLGSIESLVAIV
jgi:hypothetical protein